MSSFQIH